MRRELPALLDLLRVAVESGLSLGAALGRWASGPPARWLASGARWGRRRGSACRWPVAGRARPARAAARGARARGRAGARRPPRRAAGRRRWRPRRAMRGCARRREIEERAARAAPKIQLVVALLLVPSVLLLVAAALAAALIGGGGPAHLAARTVAARPQRCNRPCGIESARARPQLGPAGPTHATRQDFASRAGTQGW